MNIVIITGPPYSGKGTQAEIIERKYGYSHISTGDYCRAEKENETSLGIVMAQYQEKGELVPDEIMKQLFSGILDEKSDQTRVLLDGYPRTKNQVNDLVDLVKEKNCEIVKVINIEVDKEELLERASVRAETSTREDDKDINTHIKRIEIFMNETVPAIELLKSITKVESIDGMGEVEEITKRIEAVM